MLNETELLDRSPFISSYEDYSIIDDIVNIDHILWYSVNPPVCGETNEEKMEMQSAKVKQYKMGIIQQNGMPTGMIDPRQNLIKTRMSFAEKLLDKSRRGN